MASVVIRTTCPYCGVGCGIRASRSVDAISPAPATVSGDADHPANRGRLCSKGTHLADTLGLDQRLKFPVVHGQRTSWADALDHVARNLTDAIRKHGPDSVAFYVSGQLLTEDYYVANKLMKGFIGSANIDTNSRLCMASAVAGHRRAFGEDVVPGCYDDFDQADLVILVGSNAAWCHPILFQRIVAAREARGTKVVVLDPRRTDTCEVADLHLPLKPGTDVALFNGLLAYLMQQGAVDKGYIANHVSVPEGFWQKLEAHYPLTAVAQACDVPIALLEQFFEWFAQTPRTVTAFSQGVNQSSAGTDKVNAIINCHLATGRIGKVGASPFSITGQPNAMGGREVGGLANQLAAHMNFDDPEDVERIERFWGASAIARQPGLKAVDLFREVSRGRIKALWIMATNPAVSLPELSEVISGLAQAPFVVVSDCAANTDTLRFAHVLLPAAAWGEKDGTVTNSERCISRQRAFLPLAGEAKPDWWIVNEVAHRMGYGAAFPYKSTADIFREHAALSAFENDGNRAFNIGAYAGISDRDYDRMEPFHWPAVEGTPLGRARLFSNGKFSTPDRRARMVALHLRLPVSQTEPNYPLILNTGRVRDQWHTMTRTGLSARLCGHIQEPFVDIHPEDAMGFGIRDGQLTKLTSRFGAEIFRARVSPQQRRGEVFCPIHWSRQFSSGGLVGRLVNAVVDPTSGQPEFKHTPVRAEPYVSRWQGFLITTDKPNLADLAFWTRIPVRGATLYEIAGDGVLDMVVDRLLPPAKNAHRAEVFDRARAMRRLAIREGDHLKAVLFIGSQSETLPGRDWMIAQFDPEAGQEVPSVIEILAGQPAIARPDPGAQVCACFSVGVNTLITAIREQSLTTVTEIGEALRAGTNCGSCKPTIQRLLAAERAPLAS